MWGRCLLDMGQAERSEQLLKTIGAHEGGAIPYHGTVLAARYAQGLIKKAHQMYRWRATSVDLAAYFKMPQLPKDIDLLGGKHRDQDSLFVAEGGPGDEIRIAALYDELTDLCKSVTISCDPRLKSLLQRSFPAINFIPTTRYRKEVLSSDIESRSLLTNFRLYQCLSDAIITEAQGKSLVCSTLDTLMELRGERHQFKGGSRLTPDSESAEQFRTLLAQRPNRKKVGLSWRSMLTSNARNRHYLKAEDLAPLAKIEGVDFWLLQTQVTEHELSVLKDAGLTVTVPDIDLKDDFERQAALIANLDATIGPLSTMAELSGMVGTRTIIFCRTNDATWRKNNDGSDVWYENGRLLTGAPEHDVPSLISRIETELSDLVKVP